ncbi:hypothetical protein [Halorhabdus salina]|nr:hypothetical protein [Halorhabdus salina]
MHSHKTTNHNERYVVFYEFDDEGDSTTDSAVPGNEPPEGA